MLSLGIVELKDPKLNLAVPMVHTTISALLNGMMPTPDENSYRAFANYIIDSACKRKKGVRVPLVPDTRKLTQTEVDGDYTSSFKHMKCLYPYLVYRKGHVANQHQHTFRKQ